MYIFVYLLIASANKSMSCEAALAAGPSLMRCVFFYVCEVYIVRVSRRILCSE